MSSDSDATILIARSPRTLWRRIGQDVLLMDTASDSVVNVSPSGAEVWERCGAATAPLEVARAIGRAHPEISPDVIEREVLALIAQLIEQGHLTIAPAP